jgi:RNA polymerase sigma-70 factor (ECF subfamily)
MRQEQLLFEKLMLANLDAAYNLARWMVESDQGAQDIVQEAYIQASKGFGGYRGADARAWLLTIVRNTAYDWIEKHAVDLVSFDRRLVSPTRDSR